MSADAALPVAGDNEHTSILLSPFPVIGEHIYDKISRLANETVKHCL